MNHIKIRMVLCAMLVLFPVILEAQTAMEIDNANDSADVNVNVRGNDSLQVQVAFRKVGPKDLTGGVSVVNLPEIMKKNYITYGLDGMEAYIGGFPNSIWGMDEYLLLIDGIPRDIGTVMPSEIEQVTFLKGVSAVALYGSRAAKGVVYITTKRGTVARQKIDVRVNTGMYVPKSYPKYLSSAEYMTLYNEARTNDGLSELYSEETIYNYASGKNPYRYPDVNYYSTDYLKKAYNRSDITAEVTGGDKRAHYYTNFGFYSVGSLLDFGEAKNNRTNRFNIRGNVDMNLNDYISCSVDAAAIFYSARGVNTDYWSEVASLRPYRFAPLIPISLIEESDETSNQLVKNSNHIIDGKYLLGGTQLDQTNPIADIYAGGYTTYISRQFQFNTSIDFDLKNLLKGLTFHSMFGVDYSTSYNQYYENDYAVYAPTWNNYSGTDLITGLTKYGDDSKTGYQNISDSYYKQTIALSGLFNYNTVVDNNHHISAMLIANGYQQSMSEVYHKTSNVNLGLQLGYNYLGRYYFDFSGALVHSAKLPEGNREAFSPTVSLGWRISEEDFMAGLPAIDNLKLTVSAGILHTDLDISDYYLYKGIYTNTDGAWYSWRDGALAQTYDSRRGENTGLSFPKRKEINVGVEASFFKRLITVNGSFFANRITGNIIQASVLYPGYFTTSWPESSFIPYVNYNEDKRWGVDFSMNLNKRIGQIDWSLGVTGTYYDAKAAKRAENYEYSYQNRAGKPLDALWGLENKGFFVDEDDIADSPSQSFGEVQPGDIKYKDQNNDGVINSEDIVYLGKGGWYGAPFTLGINLTATWKNLTFFALGTGRFGAYAFKNSSYYWVDGDDKYSEVVRGRWTEETKNTATYPRLTTNDSENNFRSSDFWLYKTNRFSLSKIQVSYKLPESITRKSFVRDLSVYVSGSDLLTISPEREALELNVASAPQTRFYNVGVKAMF